MKKMREMTKMQTLDYVRPELVDYSYVSAKGIESCFIDCTSDELCPGDDEI